MKTFILIIISLLTTIHLEAQNKGTDNIVGTNHFIDSEILGEKRQIQIYLPPGYSETKKIYPVLYILDGQQFFLYGVSLTQNFKTFKKILVLRTNKI